MTTIIIDPTENTCSFDFGSDMPLDNEPVGSRKSDLKLGAGSLLDIGIYPLTWSRMVFHSDLGSINEDPSISSNFIFSRGIDEISSVILGYPRHRKQAICTASFLHKSGRVFGRIEGSEGSIEVFGGGESV